MSTTRISPPFCFLFFVAFFVAALGPTLALPGTIAQYDKFEVSFPVSLEYENPFDSSSIAVDAEIQ